MPGCDKNLEWRKDHASLAPIAALCAALAALSQQIAQRGFQHRGTRRFTFFPATHRLDVLADVRGDFALGETGARLLEQIEWGGEGHVGSWLGIFADIMT